MTYVSTEVSAMNHNAVMEMRALVRRILPLMSWRHHAIGALQGYVAEDCEQEVRVHLWHPDLVLTDRAIDAGRPHDHRFTLRSTVLAGAIGHEELIVSTNDNGEFDEYTVQHARKGAAPLESTGRRLNARMIDGIIFDGHSYVFPARLYHRSFVIGPAVTLVSKLNQTEDPARVLFPHGSEPVFGVQPFSQQDARRYVVEALLLLG